METPSIIWLKNNRVLKQIDSNIQVLESLAPRVYVMNFDSNRNEIYLEDFMDKFHFDFKIYGTESKLVNHIMKTFENTTNNLGILFNGIKGTGKTITAKIIANKMNLPIILINAPYPGLADFISKINCSCILFFDEFEKNFSTNKGHDLELLSIMDGVFNSKYRKVFILTTNNLFINENFIGRPSRIRYKKSFGNLSSEVVLEYLDDCLKDKSRTQEILEFIDSLSISTIDILKCIVEEVNIHNCPVSEFSKIINVEPAKYSYMVQIHSSYRGGSYSIENFKKDLSRLGTKEKNSDGEEYIIDEDVVDIYPRRINCSSSIEYMITGDNLSNLGTVVQPLNSDGIIVSEDENYTFYIKINNMKSKPSLYKGALLV